MQLLTALVGVLGACFALCACSPQGTGEWAEIMSSQRTCAGAIARTAVEVAHNCFLPWTENATAWILPFTSGGFLYIALVNVVPDLLEESSLRYSIAFHQVVAVGMREKMEAGDWLRPPLKRTAQRRGRRSIDSCFVFFLYFFSSFLFFLLSLRGVETTTEPLFKLLCLIWVVTLMPLKGEQNEVFCVKHSLDISHWMHRPG